MFHAEKKKETNKKNTKGHVCVFVKKAKIKSINATAHIELALSPCDAVIRCSFKGVQGLQMTFSVNHVSFHLLFPVTLRCAPY